MNSELIITNVMARIAEKRRARARIATAAHSSLLVLALIALFPAIQYVFDAAARSGFSQYLSLAFSDGGSLLATWKEFALTMIESAPLMAVASVLGILLIFAYSARKVSGDIGRLRVAHA